MRQRLLIEGWRLIHHSYALVTQAYCLALSKRGDVDLRFRDIPYRNPAWRRTSGLLSIADESLVARLPAPEPSFAPDVTLHMWPNFDPPPSGSKVTFGTPELGWIHQGWLHGTQTGAEVADTVSVLTPTRWTAAAYERFGIPVERIHIVPLGFDPAFFHPDDKRRAMTRARLGATDDNFVFVSMGAMTWNKGVDILLRAFARVAQSYPGARLILKGADSIYPSREQVKDWFNALAGSDQALVSSRLWYIGETLTPVGVADILRAADCYVSPYLAEGFNLPVLEAAACGLPVICTAGGCTDDFVDPSFAMQIRSRLTRLSGDENHAGDALIPDLDHLVTLMADVSAKPAAGKEMGARGALHVAQRFTWDAVTALLAEKLLCRAR